MISEKLKKAREYLKGREIPQTYKNTFHFDIPIGWMNDPNGCVEAFGKYHVFFQHYPYAATSKDVHWGHAATVNLKDWEYLPIAIAPDTEYDEDGCWSGSAILCGERLYIMYTGCADGKQQQCLAYSDDGINFVKYEANPVIKTEQLPNNSEKCAFRDPYLFKTEKGFGVLLGGRNIKKSCGRIMLYESADLINWNYSGTLAESSVMAYPGIFECPSYAKIDGEDVVVSSINFRPTDGKLHRNFADTIYMAGKIDWNTVALNEDKQTLLDYGFDYYAPQILKATDGRNILIGWAQMWEVTYPTQKFGWVGSLACPREMHMSNGKLIFTPVREIDSYFDKKHFVNITSGEVSEKNCNAPTRLKLTCGDAEIILKHGDFMVTVATDSECGEIILTREGAQVPQSKTPLEENVTERIYPCGKFKTVFLDILIDRSIMEIFINGGEGVLTTTYFGNGERTIKIFGKNAEVKGEISEAASKEKW